MKTIALAFVGLVLFAQEPKPKPPTVEELQAQVTQLTLTITKLEEREKTLQQETTQQSQQIAAMQANIVASQKMFGACFQNLTEAEQRAAAKK